MKLDDIKNLKYAYTHAGNFHADDVFSAAFLLIINDSLKFKRVNNASDVDGFMFDIGGGLFDHHGDIEYRDNGIPYATFGLLWRAFAPELYGNYVYENVDKRFIAELDLSDNTGEASSLAHAISLFNPVDETNGDQEFLDAVGFAKIILSNLIRKEKMKEEDNAFLKNLIVEKPEEKILILEKYRSFKEVLPDSGVCFIVYPSKRGGYAAQGVTISHDSLELKIKFPEIWVSDLPKGINFVHKSGFLINGETLDDVVNACKLAINFK